MEGAAAEEGAAAVFFKLYCTECRITFGCKVRDLLSIMHLDDNNFKTNNLSKKRWRKHATIIMIYLIANINPKTIRTTMPEVTSSQTR